MKKLEVKSKSTQKADFPSDKDIFLSSFLKFSFRATKNRKPNVKENILKLFLFFF